MCSIPLESPNTYSYLVSFTVTSPGVSLKGPTVGRASEAKNQDTQADVPRYKGWCQCEVFM